MTKLSSYCCCCHSRCCRRSLSLLSSWGWLFSLDFLLCFLYFILFFASNDGVASATCLNLQWVQWADWQCYLCRAKRAAWYNNNNDVAQWQQANVGLEELSSAYLQKVIHCNNNDRRLILCWCSCGVVVVAGPVLFRCYFWRTSSLQWEVRNLSKCVITIICRSDDK